MINEFQGENRFLSNFFPAHVEILGLHFNQVEAAYQAGKAVVCSNRNALIEILETGPDQAGRAKRIGRKIKMSRYELNKWDVLKVSWMTGVVQAKFRQNPELGERLLATRPKLLVEGNLWGDTFWGIDLATGRGENNLGKILTLTRDFLVFEGSLKELMRMK